MNVYVCVCIYIYICICICIYIYTESDLSGDTPASVSQRLERSAPQATLPKVWEARNLTFIGRSKDFVTLSTLRFSQGLGPKRPESYDANWVYLSCARPGRLRRPRAGGWVRQTMIGSILLALLVY